MNRRKVTQEKQLIGRRRSPTPRLTNILEAARNNNIQFIDAALRNGENINQQDDTGNSALHQAAMFNLYDVISYLLFMGADPEINNKEGNTVADICRDSDVKAFLKQSKRLTRREDYGKVVDDYATLSNDTEITFMSHHVRFTCSNLADDDNVALRCRSVRLEEVSWRYMEDTETACSDVYIVSLEKVKSLQGCEFTIPMYNLPNTTEEIVIKTNLNLEVRDITVYDKKRVSYCKFTVDLPPVLSIVAVCRQKTECFVVSMETVLLESEQDKRLKIAIPDNSVVTPGRLQLQMYNQSDYVNQFQEIGTVRSTGILNLHSNDLDLSKDPYVTIPLSDANKVSDDIKVYGLRSVDGDVSVLTTESTDTGQAVTVAHPPSGWLVAVETKESDKEKTKGNIKRAFRTISHKETSVQFQIGSKQRRNQQKRCKIIVTCSPEEEVDKNVAFWERDGFHIQWCTDTHTATSGEMFSVTLSGAMVFCNGFDTEKIQYHPRRRNYGIFEVMSNDVLSNVSLTNVDIRPVYSLEKPIVNHSMPIKKNVYIRKTDTSFLGEVGKSKENDDPELKREDSNISTKSTKQRKKKKKSLLRKFSRENTNEMKINNVDSDLIQVKEDNTEHSNALKSDTEQKTITQNANTTQDGESTRLKTRTIDVKNSNEDSDNIPPDNKESKQREVTNISSESSSVSLTSLDVNGTDKGKVTKDQRGRGVPAFVVTGPESKYMVKDDSVLTSSRPVTVRAVMLENPAVNLPVEKTFFSDAYVTVILDEIGGNWLSIYVLMGISFDVIDHRLQEWHGKTLRHDTLLKLLQEWRDENAYHIHKGVPKMLSALRKGGKWDLSVSVQRRLKIWHDQAIVVEDPLYKWLEEAYADADVFIPAEYPRPMSDEFLVMFVPEVAFSHHVTTAMSMTYEEYYEIQENNVYSNESLKLMKALAMYRLRRVDIIEMVEELVNMCDDLDYNRASQIIIVSLKGWLKRSATDNDPLKSTTDKLVSKLLHRSRKCSTPHSIFRQRLDVRSALKVLRTPTDLQGRQPRPVHSDYGKPSASK